jgi:dissimilatory sulfite reductase (desulfoviridin) alpha/beta subunit
MPAYIPHLGGRSRADATFGTRLKSRLPAKRVPDAVERWLRFYESDRSDGEVFADFVERIGAEQFEKQVKDLAMPAEFNLENMLQFVDWSRSEPYKVERGEGECAV